MAAFKASRLVWLAISEITWMISLIFSELVRISFMAEIDWRTAVPPSSANWLVSPATRLAMAALSLTPSIERVKVFDGGRNFLDAGALVLGADGQLLRALGDDPGNLGELPGVLAHLLHGRAHVLNHQVHIVPHAHRRLQGTAWRWAS